MFGYFKLYNQDFESKDKISLVIAVIIRKISTSTIEVYLMSHVI